MAAALLAVACLPTGQKTCMTDSDCKSHGMCLQGLCFFQDMPAGGGGGGGGGDTGGGGIGGGLPPALAGLVFDAPDGGARTKASSIALSVRSLPADSDAGVIQYRATLRDGGGTPLSGTLNNVGGNSWTQTLIGLVEGDWTVTAWSGDIDASIPFTVDMTGPRLTVQAPDQIRYGMPSATFIPSDGDGGAFRKDEIIQVRVTSPDPDFSSGSLKAQYAGSAPVTVSVSSDCGVGCRLFTLDLSQVAMPVFRGSVNLSATGVDNLGNAQSSSAGAAIDVTRWQWALRVDSTNGIASTPAIGSGGRVFVGTTTSTGGEVVAVEPDGGFLWTPMNTGPVSGPIAVGVGSLGERVFFQSSIAPGAVRTLPVSNWTLDMTSCVGGTSGNVNEGGVALFSHGSADVAAFAIQAANSASHATLLVPELPACWPGAPTQNISRVVPPGNIVASAGLAAVVGSNGNLRVLDYDGGVPVLRAIDQFVGAGLGTVAGLAMLSSTRIAGGGGGGPGVGRFFAFDIGASSANNAWGSAVAQSTPTSGPVIGDGGVYGVIQSMSQKSQLVRLDPTNGLELAHSAELPGSAFTVNAAPSPALGTNDKVYIVDEMGTLFVMRSTFASTDTSEWKTTLPMDTSGTVTASPTLDCNRRNAGSQTGVLYIATQSGWLISYLVDSPGGLDRSSPWPKFARDSRNTGNYDGPAIGCP
jgi:hypothetical protein